MRYWKSLPLPSSPAGFFATFLYTLSWSLEWAICKFDSSTGVQRSFVQPPRFTVSRMVLRHATQVLPCLSLSKRSNSVLLKSYKSGLVPCAIRIASRVLRDSRIVHQISWSCRDGKEMYQKACCTCETWYFAYQNPLFFDVLVAVVAAKAVRTHVNKIETMQTQK